MHPRQASLSRVSLPRRKTETPENEEQRETVSCCSSREDERMNVLDSPLEALAFNYVSFGFFAVVNNLWTWIAVVTAAVRFWRIGVAGGGSPAEESPPGDERSSGVSAPAPEEKTPGPAPIPVRVPRVEEIGVVTKGSPKFVSYYFEGGTDGESTAAVEEELVGSDGELRATEEGELVGSDGEEWWESWERALRTRMGESETAGWYRYQDLTELNGNVVRLWDGRDCRASARKESGSKRCVLW